ncbi:helix-turn-helix transcriptional regulator [Algiphilus sp.]|uniref:helix-turn-helix transcriptional regulator n=1 Tax=Algiphilus sp. TaxID=1872431 RepID=UPI003B51EC42
MPAHPDASALIGTFYRAPLSQDGWVEALRTLRDTVGANYAQMHVSDLLGDGKPLSLFTHVDTSLLEAFNNHYVHMDPRLPYYQRRDGRSYRRQDMIPDRAIQRSVIYNEFLVPTGAEQCAGIAVRGVTAGINFVGLLREETVGAFNSQDLRLFDALSPHIENALALQFELTRARARESRLQNMLDQLSIAVASFSCRGHVEYMNARAESLFARGDGVWIDASGSIRSSDLNASRAFADFFGKAQGVRREKAIAPVGARVKVNRRDSPQPLSLFFVPDSEESNGSFWVYMVDPDRPCVPDADALRDAYKLTPAELKLTLALAEGGTLSEYSDAAGITIGTCRTLLKRVFLKTDVHHQPGLVALAFRYLKMSDKL